VVVPTPFRQACRALILLALASVAVVALMTGRAPAPQMSEAR
jgi:hypothetical protein